jgi:hypothetical protein
MTTPEDKSKAVASTTAPSNTLSAEMASMLMQDANAGLENVRPEDMVIPFVTILQKTSPQVDETSGSYKEGAKVGQLFESGTQTVYDDLRVIPCSYRTVMVEWHPRESGGGFVGQHEFGYEKQFPREGNNWVTESGTILVQTMYFSCLLLLPDGGTFPVVFGFTSSQLKKARTWVTRLTTKKIIDTATGRKFTPPIYESIWHVSTVPEENDKGSWRGYKVDVEGPVQTIELFQAARKAKVMFESTAVVRPVENAGGEA